VIAAGVSRAQAEHAIAVLMGRPPAGLAVPHGSLATRVPSVPVGLPSSLLERRPDVAAEEDTMRQANSLGWLSPLDCSMGGHRSLRHGARSVPPKSGSLKLRSSGDHASWMSRRNITLREAGTRREALAHKPGQVIRSGVEDDGRQARGEESQTFEERWRSPHTATLTSARRQGVERS
jgi:hypothetical protein